MSKLIKSAVAKVTVAVLLLFSLLLTIGGIIVIMLLSSYGAYSGTEGRIASVKEELANEHLLQSMEELFSQYFEEFIIYEKEHQPQEYTEYLEQRMKSFNRDYSRENSNFFFTITDENGNVALENYTDSSYITKNVFTYCVQYSGDESRMISYYSGPHFGRITDQQMDAQRRQAQAEYPNENITQKYYFIECYVRSDMTAPDWYGHMSDAINNVFPSRYMVIGGTIASFIVSIVFFAFLMTAAGHTKNDDSIAVGGLHKLPFDLLLVFAATLFVCCIVMTVDLGFDVTENIYRLLAFLPAIGAYILFILTTMSFAVRVKAHCLMRGTILYRAFNWLWRLFRSLWHGLVYIITHAPLMWKVIIGVLALSFVEFIVIGFTRYSGDLFMFWLFEKLLIVPLILFITICLCRLRDGAKIIAGGDLDFQIDTRYMFCDFKQHAENLNHISEGMSLAVDERIKSERLKTELITNVSHDIKTPLTSIINYVDLLKKEELDNERANEYLEVLDRQSARLKKLIEDLVDASRFSTGNINVNLELTSVNILIDQIVGEYGERLDKNSLKLVIDRPEEDLYIMADGRHIWRALDNLMINICKYAMPSSRVYVTLTAQEGKVRLTFRNVSRDELNISSDELMERFVRGDKSRNTEGSGLGLSIARSLITLQGGNFEINIDGDLFKASITFGQVFPQ